MEITDREKALVKSLIGSDEQQSQYRHDFNISQKILGILISDRNFLVQSLDLIKPEYFEDKGHQLICGIVFEFFRQYKQLPQKAFIENEIRERRKNSDHVLKYLGELEAVIGDYVPGSATREYLLDKITNFAKEQACRLGVSQTIDFIER